MPSTTLNPTAGHFIVSNYGDGTTVSGADETLWDSILAGTGTKAVTSPSGGAASGRLFLVDSGVNFSDPQYYCYRSFLQFDLTGAVPGGGTVTGGMVRVYVTAKTSTQSGSVYLVGSSPASLTSGATADYTTADSTALSGTNPTVSGITTSAYLEFPLNAAGIDRLAAANGKFAFKHSLDFLSTAPTRQGIGNPSLTADVTINFAANSSNKPELVIDYSLPTAGAMRRMPSGLIAPARFVR